VLQWVRANGCQLNVYTCSAAAGAGHPLVVLQWLHANGCPWDVCSSGRSVMPLGEAGGHLAVLQWLRQLANMPDGCPWDAEACRLQGCRSKWAAGCAAVAAHVPIFLKIRAKGKAGKAKRLTSCRQ
jgi:hypothetical protein